MYIVHECIDGKFIDYKLSDITQIFLIKKTNFDVSTWI